MTNKSLFVVIFIVFSLGLVASLNIIYQQVINPNQNREISISLLKKKLKASEEQIRIISDENGVMRAEISRLKRKLDRLYKGLDEVEVIEEASDT